MPDGPRMTVAIPLCNGARHLRDAVRSLLRQEGVDFDLVVVDDRSDDDGLAIVRAEAGDRARIERNSERLGLAGNWNRCIALSGTPFVAIFHQDDVMRQGHLEAHRSAIEAEPRVGLVCSAAEVIDEQGRRASDEVERGGLGPVDRLFEVGECVPRMVVANPLRCSSVTIGAAAHADVGGFDPSYRYVVDWEFWLRVARRWRVAWLARPSVEVRWHSSSETHRFKSGIEDLEESAHLLARLDSREEIPSLDRARLRRDADRRLARAFLNRCHDATRNGDYSLARHCLRRSFELWPGIVRVIARDPRLALRLATLAVPR